MKHLHVPQYEGLNTDDILGRARTINDVMNKLPDEREILKCPKQWIINIVYTVAGEPFADWVRQKVKDRNEALALKKDLNINVDPAIAQAF